MDRILHAGDVSTPAVLKTLSTIAPVDMACGNRDWPFFGKEKWVNRLELAGVSVALMHGHGSWINYILDKAFYMYQGYRFERYKPLLKQAGKGAKVIVFGHTHRPEIVWDDGQLLFNPGSAGFGFRQGQDPGWGLLEIFSDGTVAAKIIPLDGYQMVKGRWVRKHGQTAVG